MSTTQLTSPQSETDPKGHKPRAQASISPPEINNETTALNVEVIHTEEEGCENQKEIADIDIETGDSNVEKNHSDEKESRNDDATMDNEMQKESLNVDEDNSDDSSVTV